MESFELFFLPLGFEKRVWLEKRAMSIISKRNLAIEVGVTPILEHHDHYVVCIKVFDKIVSDPKS